MEGAGLVLRARTGYLPEQSSFLDCLHEAWLLQGCLGVTFSKNKMGAFTTPAPQERSSILHIEKLEQMPHSGTTYKELWEFPHYPS